MNDHKRRQGPRIDLVLRATVQLEGEVRHAEASDISPTGLRMECDAPLPVGASLSLTLDRGDGDDTEAVSGQASVAWCRERQSPTGRQVFDVGMQFETDWLQKARGPLGIALGRLFSMQDVEPARTSTRIDQGWPADGPAGPGSLSVADLSAGGMRLTANAGTLGPKDAAVQVTVQADGQTMLLSGIIVWVKDAGREAGVAFEPAAKGALSAVPGLAAGTVQPTSLTVVFGTVVST